MIQIVGFPVQVSRGQQLTISLDGPYGRPIDFSPYRTILLCAGGIGITPIKCIFEHLLGQKGPQSVNVHLLWTARSSALFRLMLTELLELPSNFSARLFATQVANKSNRDDRTQTKLKDNVPLILDNHLSELSPKEIPFLSVGRRPDFDLEFSAWKNSGRQTLMFVCGPPSMVTRCRELAWANQWTFHSETFEL
jgi:NAD(P)H-flavin reductase